jgi:hydrophobic/amphiphilic exporter-1 (mainly G- bacteria), HAE1 family
VCDPSALCCRSVRGCRQSVVTKVDPDGSPILLVALRAEGSLRDVSELADKRVRRMLESINGGGQMTLLGARQRQINAWRILCS